MAGGEGGQVSHVDGPICPGWSISLPCGCPNAESPQLTDPERDLPAGYGWVKIVLSYPPRSGLSKLKSCPGGIAIEDQAGTAIASAGYTDGPPEYGPGIASGSTTDIVLAPGTWHAVARAGEEPFVSATFTVVAGQGAKIAIQLP
jgi:hypothetical protein